MGYKTFQIFVDSPTGSYYAGSSVTGRVVLVLDKPKKVRGLRIEFEGKAVVSWTESESVRKDDGTTANENITYSSEEKYFSIQYFLIGSESSEVEIPPGENIYQFSTTLPPRLPTSFDGEHGHIRYTIKAVLDRPWKIDEEIKLPITVVTPVDLNFLPQVQEPVEKEVSKTFCCLCCKSGPLTLVGSIPFSGYVPGQTIVATIEVDNASNVEISKVSVTLKKEMRWTVKSPSHKVKEDLIELAKFKLEGVAAHGSKSWSQNIEIPHMPFINLDACSLIHVNFYLKVEADPSGAHTSLDMKFPITLGTVPINKSLNGAPTVAPPAVAAPLNMYPSAPPSAPPEVNDPRPIGFNMPSTLLPS